MTDYLSYYKLNNKSIPLKEEKDLQKLKDCKMFIVIEVLGHSNIGVH